MTLPGNALENTLDNLRGLSTSKHEKVALNAGAALKELVKTIAGKISMRQMQPQGVAPRTNTLGLPAVATQHPKWSIVKFNYDDLLDWVFGIIRTNSGATTVQCGYSEARDCCYSSQAIIQPDLKY
jgi:hypothetical protein